VEGNIRGGFIVIAWICGSKERKVSEVWVWREKTSLKEGRGVQPRELHKEEVLGVGIDS